MIIVKFKSVFYRLKVSIYKPKFYVIYFKFRFFKFNKFNKMLVPLLEPQLSMFGKLLNLTKLSLSI